MTEIKVFGNILWKRILMSGTENCIINLRFILHVTLPFPFKY
jgi:hypothetical protein